MPANYKRLVDELIPDMKNQVNGQAFADIEDGFQGKVNKATRNVSEKLSRGLGSITGGRGRVDIKVDVELNESFQRLGRIGKMALDGENINSIVTAAYPSDEARERALYAGQGTQAPPLPAANGPWSVMVPGVAYMRFVVHGGNLQGDNMMQIRILKPIKTTAALTRRPHLVLAEYPQGSATKPTLPNLFAGGVNQAALAQCQTFSTQQGPCSLAAMSFGGLTAYSVGTGDQAPIMAASQPLPPISGITATPRIAINRADISSNRTTIGVGEIVDLTAAGSDSITWSVNPAKLGCLTATGTSPQGTECKWSVTAAKATFTAFDQSGAVEVTAAHERSSQSLTLTIVRPQRAMWLPIQPPQIQPTPAITDLLASTWVPTLHPKGECKVGAEGYYFLAPDNVSFSRVRYREKNVATTFSGDFGTHREPNGHCAPLPGKPKGTQWCDYLPVSKTVRQKAGSRGVYADNAYWFDIPPRVCRQGFNGTVALPIDVQFRVTTYLTDQGGSR